MVFQLSAEEKMRWCVYGAGVAVSFLGRGGCTGPRIGLMFWGTSKRSVVIVVVVVVVVVVFVVDDDDDGVAIFSAALVLLSYSGHGPVPD